MWISERISKAAAAEAENVSLGRVTIGGSSAGVLTDGEARGVAVVSPGGYVWAPAVGQSVLVMKSGGESFILGQTGTEQVEEAGEVYIKSNGGAAVRLKNTGEIVLEGTVEIKGNLIVNGVPYVSGG